MRRSHYFSAKRKRAPAKWRLQALQVATGAQRQPWESVQAFSRRLQAEEREARRSPLYEPPEGSVAAQLLGRATPLVSLSSVKPLPSANEWIGVYVLQSTVQPSRVYIGFSTDPDHRLRQHNGEIAGSSKFCKIGRPYKTLLRVSGFRAQVTALQYEWALTKHTRSTHARPLLAHPVMRARLDAAGVKARLAQLLMFSNMFCDEPLRVEWHCGEAREAHEIEFGNE